jgi:hypothetical protein
MSTAAVRVCVQHDAVAFVDENRDRVICPKGPNGGHRLTPSQWTVRTAELGGDALVMEEARRALRDRSDQAGAAEMLIAAARLKPRLLSALLDDAAGRAIARASGRSIPEQLGPARVARHTAVERERPTPRGARSDTDRGLELMAASNLRDLLGQEILPGVVLRDAQGDQVLTAADAAAADARAGAVRSRWLRLIAARLPSVRRVGQVFDEGTVQRLHHQAAAELQAILQGLSKRLTTRERSLERAS